MRGVKREHRRLRTIVLVILLVTVIAIVLTTPLSRKFTTKPRRHGEDPT